MKETDKFELFDWLSVLAGCIFLIIRTTDVSPVLFIIGAVFCIIEGVVDIYLYFRQQKEKRRIWRLLYSAFIVVACIQGIHLLCVKAG